MSARVNSSYLSCEADLNAIVKEYLEYIELSDTCSCFLNELKSRGKPLSTNTHRPTNQKILAIQNQLVQFFHFGNRKEFFSLWQQELPKGLLDDTASQKLEFYLNVHFSVFPFRNGEENTPLNQKDRETALLHFKHYLETRGVIFSRVEECMSFFALPFVPNPYDHPSFQDLFTENWLNSLQKKLEKFLSFALESVPRPLLFQLYSSFGPERGHQRELENFERIALQSEHKSATLLKRYRKLQKQYDNVLKVGAELVDTLEATCRGQMVSPEYLEQICYRILATDISDSSIDFHRPGTAGDLIRASIQSNNVKQQQQDHQPQLKSSSKTTFVDYNAMKQDLVNGETRRKALLLQAFRWQLTRSAPGDHRSAVIAAYISHDVLGCSTGNNGILSTLLSENDDVVVRQNCARLVNAIASLYSGRSYLSPDSTNELLISALRNDNLDTITRENILGAIQKLSLRRHLQLLMIEKNLIAWLVDILSDYDSMSDYMLEYSVALLMNLCLRSAGKARAAELPERILKVLQDLLDHESEDVKSCVHGCLILGHSTVRQAANAMSLGDLLKSIMTDEQPELNRKIEFILKQLGRDDVFEEAASDGEDDDDETQDAVEADLDEAEVIQANQDELAGEKLLAKYNVEQGKDGFPQQIGANAGAGPGGSDGLISSRPVTPATSRANAQDQKSTLYSEEYLSAFGSRPRVLRTPALDGAATAERTTTIPQTLPKPRIESGKKQTPPAQPVQPAEGPDRKATSPGPAPTNVSVAAKTSARSSATIGRRVEIHESQNMIVSPAHSPDAVDADAVNAISASPVKAATVHEDEDEEQLYTPPESLHEDLPAGETTERRPKDTAGDSNDYEDDFE